MDNSTIRLELMKVLIPQAARNAILDPDMLIEKCTSFERYVLGSTYSGESLTPQTTGEKSSPQKRQAIKTSAKGTDPTHVDKSNQSV